MEMKAILRLLALLLMMECFTVAMATDSSDVVSNAQDSITPNDEGPMKPESREKRSREEIMFGNQQNKPSGLVDDLMGMPNKVEGEDNLVTNGDDGTKNTTDTQDSDQQNLEEALKDDKDDEKRNVPLSKYEMVDNDSIDNWYTGPQVSEDALHYLVSPPVQALPSESEDDGSSLYDQEIYRRKRQLLGHPLPLRKRSLRSPLGQMVSRGRRLPRRSMRLKRQVDVEDLLSLLGNLDNTNGRFLEEQVPSNYNNYNLRLHELPQPELRYPYSLVRPENDEEENDDEGGEIYGARFLEADPSLLYGGRNDVEPLKVPEWKVPKGTEWMVRHPPSVFSVARRSSPSFYPLDYRFIPSPYNKKRTPRGRPMMNGGGEDGEEETDLGKWGRIVQVPEAYASAEDVARLYALANLMAETDDSQPRIRRSL